MSVDSEVLQKDLCDLLQGMREVKAGLLCRPNSATDDSYISLMTTFVSEADDQLKEAQRQVSLAQETFLDVLSFYGESNSATSLELYRELHLFMSSYEV